MAHAQPLPCVTLWALSLNFILLQAFSAVRCFFAFSDFPPIFGQIVFRKVVFFARKTRFLIGLWSPSESLGPFQDQAAVWRRYSIECIIGGDLAWVLFAVLR